FPFTPIIIVTAMTDARDVVAGLEAGADPHLAKPVDHAALGARVRSMLRIKALHDTVTAQAEEIARWNTTLERRVAEQVAELEQEGTLERFTGDGMMIFFNDPVPVANPEERSVRMADAMRARVRALSGEWRRRGHELDFSVGIAKGYATIGAIGFEGRWDYAAIGSVTNLAARLCSEASPDQILVSQRIFAAVADLAEAKEVGPLQLKGFHRPIAAYA